MIIYALHDECHGIIGYYANDYTAKERCKENAKLYNIDPATTELDYDGAWHWGWTDSYIERIDVIED